LTYQKTDFWQFTTRKEGEKLMENEFYAEVRNRNKAKFIAIATKDIEKQQALEGGVNIPAFIEAEQAYKDFDRAGCFDEYGRLKPMPQA